MILLTGATALFVRSQLDLGTPVVGVSQVAVQDNQFFPAAIEIPPGTTVTWRWEGTKDHNVVGASFEAPTQTDGTFSQTFSEPGTHSYECTLHLFMRGEVIVTD
jgi:plastocyanin